MAWPVASGPLGFYGFSRLSLDDAGFPELPTDDCLPEFTALVFTAVQPPAPKDILRGLSLREAWREGSPEFMLKVNIRF